MRTRSAPAGKPGAVDKPPRRGLPCRTRTRSTSPRPCAARPGGVRRGSRMYLDLTPEQKAFRDQLREYLARLVTPELLEEMRGSEGGSPGFRRALRQMGTRRPARHRLAQGIRRPGARADRAVHLLRRGAALGLPAALPHARHRRPDADAPRQRRAAPRVPAEDPARRDALRDRLLGGRAPAPISPGSRPRPSATATAG